MTPVDVTPVQAGFPTGFNFPVIFIIYGVTESIFLDRPAATVLAPAGPDYTQNRALSQYHGCGRV